MDKRIEKLSELTGRTTGSIIRNKNNDNFSLDVVYQFAEWFAQEIYNERRYNLAIHDMITFNQWLKNFKKEQDNGQKD